MLTVILAALKDGFKLAHAKEILWLSECIVQYLDGEYTNDESTRNAALDSLSEFILSKKTAVTTAPTNPEVIYVPQEI